MSVFDGGGEVGRDLAALDWAASPLGSPDRWPQSLNSVVSMMLRSRFSMWMAWGPDLTFFCNAAYRRDTLGAKYPWALGRPAREVWAEIWPDIGPRIDRVLTTGEATWDEGLLLFLERSGYREETYHTFSYSPLNDDDGGVVGMLCVVTEDTERVIGARRMSTLRDLGWDPEGSHTEAEVLSSSARQLAANASDLPFALLYTYETGGATARLAAASGDPGPQLAPEVIAGDHPAAWPSEALIGGRSVLVDDLASVFATVPRGAWDEPARQALVVPLPGQGQDRPAGFMVAGLNRYRPLDDGYRTFLELVAGQIAARLASARAYESERERAEQLAELDRAKTAFFANVSHEFRTPLTLLLGPVEDALGDTSEPLGGRQRERVEVMQRNGLRLLKLVNTLLDFSRLEAGQLEARFEPTDLAAYTAELASAFATAVDRVGLELVVDCPPLPEPVWVDQDLWAKVVLNLLSNTLKFTFEGKITVRVDAGDGYVALSVADTGVGIAPEEQGRLFERFYRASVPRARTHEGSGIGLALVAELAALHGGEVSVASELGKGSEFAVRLPTGNAHLPPDHLWEPASAGPRRTGVEVSAGRLAEGFVAEAQRWSDHVPDAAPVLDGRDTRPRVLVIDDNADMREYVARLLAEEYAVIAASDGLEGVELARRHVPDLVLSDVMMPGLDGFGVLAELRADVATEHIPLVLLSARAGEEATVEGLEAGADDYLVKPFTARELLARIHANLELDRARRIRRRLERSQSMLDKTQRLARIGSWEFDIESGAITVSDEMRGHLDLTDDELGAGGLSVLTARAHPDDVPAVQAALARALATGDALEYEARLVAGDGSVRVYRALGEVVADADGRPTLLRGSHQDVTEARAAEQALATAAANREAAARERRIADELQRSLVPAPTFSPANLTIATLYRPGVEGTQVGGDWYDVIELGADRTALVLGDVMGRGVPAAAVMGQLRAAIRAYARLDLPPAHVLELLDGAVRDLGDEQIVTCIYAIYDPGDGTLTYANAGHLPPILRLPGRVPHRLLGAAGPPLGIGGTRPDAAEIRLPPDALLALYTDGLIERRGTDIDEGIDRLAGLLAGVDGPIADLPASLVDALLPDGPDDDVAILLVRVRDMAAPPRSTSLQVTSEDEAVRGARRFVVDALAEWGVGEDVASDAVLLASELVTNAIIHGRAPVELKLRLSPSALVLQVLDGSPAVPQRRPTSTYDEHGRGLRIVAALSDRWGTRPRVDGKAIWCALALPEGSRSVN